MGTNSHIKEQAKFSIVGSGDGEIFLVVSGSQMRTIQLLTALKFFQYRLPKRPTKRIKASSSNESSTTTALTQDGGLKGSKTTSGRHE